MNTSVSPNLWLAMSTDEKFHGILKQDDFPDDDDFECGANFVWTFDEITINSIISFIKSELENTQYNEIKRYFLDIWISINTYERLPSLIGLILLEITLIS